MDDQLAGRRAIVTGAGGFIGSHLTEALVASGAHVRAFVRYNSRGDIGLLRFLPEGTLRELDIVPGDLLDHQAVREAVSGMDLVFHLGALISIPYSYLHPVEVVKSNLLGTLNILAACRQVGIDRLIHASTSEVYGSAQRIPMDESHPLQGQSPYSASKIGADKLVESFTNTYELPAVIVRPFNTFGPRQSARAVIPTIITQALSQDQIYLGALDTTRDFTFVSDTVRGFLHASASESAVGQTMNLGTGREISIGALAEMIAALIDRRVEITLDRTRIRPEKSEVNRLCSNNASAMRLLGWQPQVSLEEGLRRTIEWIKSNIDQYQVGVYEY